MWESRWVFANALHENICSIFFCFDNCFVFFCFVWSETLTQAHACERTLVVNQPIGEKFCCFFWGHVRVAIGFRLPGEYCYLFYCILALKIWGTCLRVCVGRQSTDWRQSCFWGRIRVATGSRLPGEYCFLFCVIAYAWQALKRRY